MKRVKIYSPKLKGETTKNDTRIRENARRVLPLHVILFMIVLTIIIPGVAFSQKNTDSELEKMPPALERDFALSALPTHLRAAASVYLLDPAKGFYIVHKGTNGFICFVSRTEWEWGEFRKDLATPMSYDAEGARTIFRVYQDVSVMRASGKFTALQIKDTVIKRIKKGLYKAPSKPGISYMLAPVMRLYAGGPDNKNITTMSGPHYMFYAPYLINTDIGGTPQGPFINNAGDAILGKGKGPFGYIILPAGEAESAKIVADGKSLMKRLTDYKPYFKVESESMHHH